MSNYVLTRPSFAGYITTASGYDLATSASALTTPVKTLGSVREVVFEVTGETLTATSTNYNDAVVKTARSAIAGTLTLQLEEVTSSAHLLLWGITGSAAAWTADMSATTPTDYTIVTHPWYIDGSASTMILTKCNAQPNSTRRIGKEQEILEVKFDVMVDVDASAGKKFVRWLQA